MMAAPKNRGQTQNLRRGSKPAATETKKVAGTPFQPGTVNNPAGNAAALQRARKQEEALRETARHDPEKVQEELYSELSVAALRLTRKLNRQGGEPTKALIDAWREVRQAGLVVLEIRRTRGALAEAEEFFATLHRRLEALAPRLEASAYPVIEVPAGPSDVLDGDGELRG